MVQDILSRHCSSDITLTDNETFVTDRLHLSVELVYEAKVIPNTLMIVLITVIMSGIKVTIRGQS